MEASWGKLVQDLREFSSDTLTLIAASPEKDGSHACVTVRVVTGEVFESCHLEFCVVADPKGTSIQLLNSDASPEGVRDAIAEGVRDAIAEAKSTLSIGTPSESVRSALLRVFDALCIDLDPTQSIKLAALGRAGCNDPPTPVSLQRDMSGSSTFSFESLHYEQSGGEDISPGGDKSRACTFQGYAADITHRAPAVDDVIIWDAMVHDLKSLPGRIIELKSAGSWDGMEGLVHLVVFSPGGFDWDQLEVTLIVHAKQTKIELKGAQVIPDIVAHAIATLKDSQNLGSGPLSLRSAVGALCTVLCIPLDAQQQQRLNSLGDRSTTTLLSKFKDSPDVHGTDELNREAHAVEVLGVQLELIANQIRHLESRLGFEFCVENGLKHELEVLQRAHSEVAAERVAASAAVEAALLSLSDTGARKRKSTVDKTISVSIRHGPSQSLRGVGIENATQNIQDSLANAGPWGHYAAYQFALMLQREQEFHDEFICFYHSYSFAALMYEVHAEVARCIYGLPTDFAPVPRLSLASTNICASLKSLIEKGGSDHNPAFRALGLSSSCSLFASGSEAPPLSCFQAGYSCNDLSFRKLLISFIASCLGAKSGKSSTAVEVADAVIKVGHRHNLPVCGYTNAHSTFTQNVGALTGYMLQIFIHRSIVEEYAYPSQPYGKRIDCSMLEYSTKNGSQADGQARILFHPPTFLEPTKARLFHYCARPLQSCMSVEVASSRGAFIKDLRVALKPVLEQQHAIPKRLHLL